MQTLATVIAFLLCTTLAVQSYPGDRAFSRQARNAYVQKLFSNRNFKDSFVKLLQEGGMPKSTRNVKKPARITKIRKQGPFRSLFTRES